MKKVISGHRSPFTHFKIPRHKMKHKSLQQPLHVDRHFQLLVLFITLFSHFYRINFHKSIKLSMIFQRCSSLERPLSSSTSNARAIQNSRQCPSPLPAHMTKGIKLFALKFNYCVLSFYRSL